MRNKDRACAFLRSADLGINGIELVEDSDENVFLYGDFKLLHEIGGNSIPLDFNMESQGTMAWFNLMGPVLESLENGSVLVIDELDAKLHPVLSAKLLGLFESEEINKKKCSVNFFIA